MQFMFDNFVLNTYDDIKPYLDDLLARELTTKEDTLLWLKDMDSLQKSITEDVAWRTIRHSCDTADKTYKDAYMYFIQEISPKLSEKDDLLNKKLVNAADISSIEASDEAFFILLRGVRKSIEMFKEENIPLDTQIAEKAKEFGETA